MEKSKLEKANETIGSKVIAAYKGIEHTVVDQYTKVEDRFVGRFLTREGETVQQAKERLKQDQQEK